MKKVPVVILWAVAFAFVEASVVEYLRALYYPLSKGGFSFPVVTLEQLTSMGEEHVHRLMIELGRELSTMAMLVTIAIAAARNRREGWAHFMVAFGVWDIFYYVWLKVFLGWPASLMTWDLLFLVPVPWVSPVLAPVLISLALIASGLTVLYYEDRGAPLSTTWTNWVVLTAGGLIVILSFCWDSRNIMNGGVPNPFNWPLFAVGLAMAASTFAAILVRRRGRGGDEGSASSP